MPNKDMHLATIQWALFHAAMGLAHGVWNEEDAKLLQVIDHWLDDKIHTASGTTTVRADPITGKDTHLATIQWALFNAAATLANGVWDGEDARLLQAVEHWISEKALEGNVTGVAALEHALNKPDDTDATDTPIFEP